ncbi:E3 ubiquitin-protein ligase HERC2 [Bagarius yarrelli]|uniref:E3 ubiquitin-protein ligase HERC2 n=1 Tax=Bagarius yarrelli TaxID=175774 RepID=A0A556VCF4_BAGYA|nr:E3 ubiquitin-protein ligase HERC2 [Bagarius yarrelli]
MEFKARIGLTLKPRERELPLPQTRRYSKWTAPLNYGVPRARLEKRINDRRDSHARTEEGHEPGVSFVVCSVSGFMRGSVKGAAPIGDSGVVSEGVALCGNKLQCAEKRKEKEKELDELKKADQDHASVVSMPSSSPAEATPSHTSDPIDSFADVSQMISEFKVRLEDFCKQELDKIFTHRSLASEESLTVKFPKNTNWKGPVSEMERVTAEAVRTIKVGDRVRVKSSVVSPSSGWGEVKRGSVGVVKSLDKENITVNFPEHFNWIGIVSEMDIVS